MTRVTEPEIKNLATANGIPPQNLRAVIEVESSGKGFDERTGKIIIQFEPLWFKRLYTDWQKQAGSHTWQFNGVSNQDTEWAAFNLAFAENPDAAMQSTSIGMGQIMGFHYASLGFKTVGEMWDYAKASEYNQVEMMVRFIKANKKMYQALIVGDFAGFAYYYNGPKYTMFKYDTRLAAAAHKWSKAVS